MAADSSVEEDARNWMQKLGDFINTYKVQTILLAVGPIGMSFVLELTVKQDLKIGMFFIFLAITIMALSSILFERGHFVDMHSKSCKSRYPRDGRSIPREIIRKLSDATEHPEHEPVQAMESLNSEDSSNTVPVVKLHAEVVIHPQKEISEDSGLGRSAASPPVESTSRGQSDSNSPSLSLKEEPSSSSAHSAVSGTGHAETKLELESKAEVPSSEAKEDDSEDRKNGSSEPDV